MVKLTRPLGGVVLGVTVALVLIGTAAAAGAAPPAAGTGYDVSYPQCGRRLPAPGAFAIVGVNGGLPYSANPCLAAQYRWAATSSGEGPKASLYINTANPGPAVSSHWPTGQQAPKACDGTWSTACAYDYGWNAAGDAFATAAAALTTQIAASVPWWLDVETANSWNGQDLTTNTAALRGYLDRLAALAPSQPIGIYSASGAWATITGAAAPTSPINQPFATIPNWVAGATAKTAPGFCTSRSFTGGPVRYVQYVSGGIDHDYAC
jgi:hypothetical protein